MLLTIRVAHDALEAFTLRKKGFVEQPETLGEHLRNRRLMQGLSQEEVSQRLETLPEVYDRWERDFRQPVVSEWPGILSFLGYYPFAQNTAADLVLKARRCRGMDLKQMAQAVGVIHQKLRRWEHGSESPDENTMLRLAKMATFPLLH
ncbi:MAG: helix-turn-helix transcriptional regulator [Prosthecobacter sp.]